MTMEDVLVSPHPHPQPVLPACLQPGVSEGIPLMGGLKIQGFAIALSRVPGEGMAPR